MFELIESTSMIDFAQRPVNITVVLVYSKLRTSRA